MCVTQSTLAVANGIPVMNKMMWRRGGKYKRSWKFIQQTHFWEPSFWNTTKWNNTWQNEISSVAVIQRRGHAISLCWRLAGLVCGQQHHVIIGFFLTIILRFCPEKVTNSGKPISNLLSLILSLPTSGYYHNLDCFDPVTPVFRLFHVPSERAQSRFPDSWQKCWDQSANWKCGRTRLGYFPRVCK